MSKQRTLEELFAEVEYIFKDGYDAALKNLLDDDCKSLLDNKTKSELTNNGWYKRK